MNRIYYSFIVLSQYFTISFIKNSEKSFSLVYQLSKNSWFWFLITGWSFKLLGINPAWIYYNKKSLCDLYLEFFSFRRFSFSASCFFFLSPNIVWMRKLFSPLVVSSTSVAVDACEESKTLLLLCMPAEKRMKLKKL